MARRPSRQSLSTGILVVLLAGVLVSQALQAGATHQPANKAVAAASTLEVLSEDQAEPILTANFKSSKPADFVLSLALECSIWTRLVTGALPGNNPQDQVSDTTAEGRIDIELKLDGTTIVPIASSSAPPQDGRTVLESKKVTFCNQVRQRRVTDSENQGTGNPNDGQDTIDDFLATKSANAFNWVLLNAGAGVHKIEVFATFTETEDIDASDGDHSDAEAAIGTRTLIVASEKMSNDTVVDISGTS